MPADPQLIFHAYPRRVEHRSILVHRGRTATKDGFQQPAMNYLKGDKERVTNACRAGIYEIASIPVSIVPGYHVYPVGISFGRLLRVHEERRMSGGSTGTVGYEAKQKSNAR